MSIDILVTLWPSFPHFPRFARDKRLSGIRLNSAMMEASELDKELKIANSIKDPVPLYFDIKGRQLRVRKVDAFMDHLELDLNHPIEVETPTLVLFKAGSDRAVLEKVENGTHLVFDGGPSFMVKAGESLHIRHPSLKVSGPIFCEYELEKLQKVVKAGFTRYFLSYVEDQKEIDEFREFIGKEAELILKIESKQGLTFVENQFKKDEYTSLMAARGDLFVEVDRPHDMLAAMKLIISKDPEAFAGSRMLLSMVKGIVPELSDLTDLAWMHDIGYRRMMLCDELCLKEPLLGAAVNVMSAFKDTYACGKIWKP